MAVGDPDKVTQKGIWRFFSHPTTKPEMQISIFIFGGLSIAVAIVIQYTHTHTPVSIIIGWKNTHALQEKKTNPRRVLWEVHEATVDCELSVGPLESPDLCREFLFLPASLSLSFWGFRNQWERRKKGGRLPDKQQREKEKATRRGECALRSTSPVHNGNPRPRRCSSPIPGRRMRLWRMLLTRSRSLFLVTEDVPPAAALMMGPGAAASLFPYSQRHVTPLNRHWWKKKTLKRRADHRTQSF